VKAAKTTSRKSPIKTQKKPAQRPSTVGLFAGPADLILNGGKIITADKPFTIAQAVAIKDGRFIAVGTNQDIKPLAGPRTKIVALRGKSVVPGFIDTHGHIGLFGIETLWVSLTGARSIPGIVKRIAARVRSTLRGNWVVTTPVGDPPYYFRVPEILKEGRFPTRWDLDTVSPEHPVYITAPTNRVPNSAVLNSHALKLAGITRDTPRDFDGIEVVKDPATGEPTGELHGMQPIYNPSAFYARFSELLPPLSYEGVRQGIKNLAPSFVAGGTTSLLENHLTSPEELRAYVELDRQGDLPLRVFYTFDIDPLQSLDSIDKQMRAISFAGGRGFGGDRIRIAGVSIGLDGPHWHGAAVADRPYPGPDGKTVDPKPIVPWEIYSAIIKMAAGYGLRVHAEAAGRGSIGIALAAIAQADAVHPIKDLRYVLEHCEFPTREQIAQCKTLGIVPTTATNFIWGKGAEVFHDRLGADYAQEAIPLRWWLDAGVPICQSTDWGPHEPMFTLWQSLARESGLTKEVFGADQRISREEAIRIFTNNGAYALWMEDQLGSIEPGKLADVAVIAGDPLTCAEADIKKLEVVGTIVGGKVVHRGGDLNA